MSKDIRLANLSICAAILAISGEQPKKSKKRGDVTNGENQR
jgi:hypothetical protein